MKSNTLLLLQSALIFLQMVNGALGVELNPPVIVVVLIGAFVGAFQFYVNHLGNQIVPDKKE